MTSRGKVSKDQLQFEVKIEKTIWKNRETKRKEKQGELREESSTISSFSIIQETLWLKSNHYNLEEHLEITPCNKDQSIFLVLQYLLPLRSWDETCIPHSDQYPSIYNNGP